MTEYDSGSSSDSSSDSTPSPDSTPSGSGIDFSPLAQSFVESLLDPGTPTRPSSWSTGDQSSGALLDPAIQALFAASGPVKDERSLVRRIVEAERWFVPTAPDGAFEQVPVADERTRRALELSSGDGSTVDRHGRAAPLPSSAVQAFTGDPGCPARQLSGRELARALQDQTGGLLLATSADSSSSSALVGLRRADFPLLAQLADSLDLEEILLNPAQGQLQALQQARWYVPAANEKLRPTKPGHGDPRILVYTHPDRAEAKDQPMVELDRRTLCTRLANRTSYVGIAVNWGSQVGQGEQETHAFLLGPSFAQGIARGVDTRPGAAPLRARTLAEVVLWLDLVDFPWEHREIVTADTPGMQPAPDGTVLIQVRSNTSTNWRVYETGYRQPKRDGPILSPVFALARPDQLPSSLPAPIPPAFATRYRGHLNDDKSIGPASIDLGEGQTEIICAGLLAQGIYRPHSSGASGWLVTKRQRLYTARVAGWAHELLELIPPDADAVPPSSLRTVEGASFARGHEWTISRRWLEEQRVKYTRAASRWFNV